MEANFERGDLLEIHWCDISEDSVGDPNKASLSRRVSYGLFWESKIDGTVPVMVTTTTIDTGDITGQSGWCIYPESCLTKVKVVRKVRKARVRKERQASGA